MVLQESLPARHDYPPKLMLRSMSFWLPNKQATAVTTQHIMHGPGPGVWTTRTLKTATGHCSGRARNDLAMFAAECLKPEKLHESHLSEARSNSQRRQPLRGTLPGFLHRTTRHEHCEGPQEVPGCPRIRRCPGHDLEVPKHLMLERRSLI